MATTTQPAPNRTGPRHDVSVLTEDDLYLFNEGSHFRMFDRLGARVIEVDGEIGTLFGVWAPNAEYVAAVGDFNGWDAGAHPMHSRGSSGIWEVFAPGVKPGVVYKYHVASRYHGYKSDRADPFGYQHEVPSRDATASVVADLDFDWTDGEWLAGRGAKNALGAPISIYEVHLGSWKRKPDEGGRWLNYREAAHDLAEYCNWMGFTHVEFLPLMEHPFYGSWGYQTTGYFAPTSRYGTPQDFMYLVDHLHRHGIGVIVDWVPSHFPTDGHGLAYFDGTHLYEHADDRIGFHPDWKSYIFNYGRNEIRSFLISSAMFWLEKFHIDGIRVDAVASMLYRDYSRKDGEWIPNQFGGRENIEAIDFLRRLNEEVYRGFPDVQTFAEESTAWPMVSRPNYVGGLGFGLKWDMGWMHDTLKYMAQATVPRRNHHGQITFRMLYAFNENFCLPLSHDEVVHGKGSLLDKMPGDKWQKLANLRLLYGYMFTQAGKKLLFMGGEFGQPGEWEHDGSIDWHLMDDPGHRGVALWLKNLNRVYRETPALHLHDVDPAGFDWVDAGDSDNSVLCYLRQAEDHASALVVLNFTPVVRGGYRVGVPYGGYWSEVLNSDAAEFGGSNVGNMGGLEADATPWHGRPASVVLTLPPLSAVVLKGG